MSDKDTLHAVPPVSGYRPLSDADVARMNAIKAKAQELLALHDELVQATLTENNELWAAEQNATTLLRAAEQDSETNPQGVAAAQAALDTIAAKFQALQQSEPLRWAAIGRSDIQKGVMALCRAIARPDGSF